MKSSFRRQQSEGPERDQAVHASISFPSEVYETLEAMAKEKKVSLAWVVGEAAEEYIGGKWPFFRKARQHQ